MAAKTGPPVRIETTDHDQRDATVAVNGLAATIRLRRDGSGWAVREFTVRTDSGSLVGNDVRALPIGKLLAMAQQAVTERESASGLVSPTATNLVAFTDGRPEAERTDTDYALLAFEYAERVRHGARAPLREIADRVGGSPRTWTNRLMDARRRGLLTPSTPSKASGELTEKADLLLFGGDEPRK